jgi:hypothetical protein
LREKSLLVFVYHISLWDLCVIDPRPMDTNRCALCFFSTGWRFSWRFSGNTNPVIV